MATFTWTGQATDSPTTDVVIGATDKINFSGAAFDDAITVGAYQTSTHIEDSEKAEQCATTHMNNTMYVSSQSIAINGGAAESLTNVLTTECPLKINFANDPAVALSDVDFYAYDDTTDATGPTDVTVYCAEQADTDWVAADGSGAELSLGDSGSATTHDFFIALSASPDSVGEKLEFTWKMALAYQ